MPIIDRYDVIRETLRNVAESDIFERRVMDNVALDTWVAADGHVVLIGDGQSPVSSQKQLPRGALLRMHLALMLGDVFSSCVAP